MKLSPPTTPAELATEALTRLQTMEDHPLDPDQAAELADLIERVAALAESLSPDPSPQDHGMGM